MAGIGYISVMNTLIIFDLDGTLADTRADLANAVNLARKEYGLPEQSIKEIVNYVGEGKYNLMKNSLHDKPDVDLEEAVAKFMHHYAANLIIKTYLYDGVAEGIKKLKGKNYHLAVCSNKPGDLCRQITAHFGLDKYLVTTKGGGDAATIKPEPEGVYEIIRLAENDGFSRNGDNVWMIGDHHTDLRVAENAGIKSIFCKYGFGSKKDQSSDYEVSSFSEIADIVG